MANYEEESEQRGGWKEVPLAHCRIHCLCRRASEEETKGSEVDSEEMDFDSD